jgi:hypothetical protein
VPSIIAEARHHAVPGHADQSRKGEDPQASPWVETSQAPVACGYDVIIVYARSTNGTSCYNAGSNPIQRRLLL